MTESSSQSSTREADFGTRGDAFHRGELSSEEQKRLTADLIEKQRASVSRNGFLAAVGVCILLGLVLVILVPMHLGARGSLQDLREDVSSLTTAKTRAESGLKSTSKDKEALTRQVAALKGQQTDLQSKLTEEIRAHKSLKQESEELHRAKKTVEGERDTLRESCTDLKESLGTLEKQVKQLKGQAAEARQQATSAEAKLETLASAMRPVLPPESGADFETDGGVKALAAGFKKHAGALKEDAARVKELNGRVQALNDEKTAAEIERAKLKRKSEVSELALGILTRVRAGEQGQETLRYALGELESRGLSDGESLDADTERLLCKAIRTVIASVHRDGDHDHVADKPHFLFGRDPAVLVSLEADEVVFRSTDLARDPYRHPLQGASISVGASNDHQLAMGDDRGQVVVWRKGLNGQVAIPVHDGLRFKMTGMITLLEFSPDGSCLVGIDENKQCRAWSLRRGDSEDRSISLNSSELPTTLAVAASRLVAIGTDYGYTRLWYSSESKPDDAPHGETDWETVKSLTFSPTSIRRPGRVGGKEEFWLASIHSDRRVQLSKTLGVKSQILKDPATGKAIAAVGIAFLSTTAFVLATTDNVSLWELERGRWVRVNRDATHPGVRYFKANRYGCFVTVGAGRCRVWETARGSVPRVVDDFPVHIASDDKLNVQVAGGREIRGLALSAGEGRVIRRSLRSLQVVTPSGLRDLRDHAEALLGRL